MTDVVIPLRRNLRFQTFWTGSMSATLGQAVAEITARRLDLQLALNLRAAILFYRESVDLLRAAGADAHGAVYPGEHNLATIEAHLASMLTYAGRSLSLRP